ncbi:MAG: HtaA domain-containing protein [Leucobacter sp.]
MKARSIRKGSALAGAVLLGALLSSPVAAHASPVVAEEGAEGGCVVTDGTFTWGVKESFRSYISGTIANGEWEASDGAEYETPNFSWSSPTGAIDPATGIGSVSFAGSVHFSGHDGVLDLTLANPTIEFEGDGKAALLLDTKSADMEGETAVDTEQEWIGDITVESDAIPTDGVLELADLPATLTNSGVTAFGGFYEAGDELDPLSLSLELEDCETDTAAAAPPVTDDAASTPAPVQAEIPWLPIIIGGAALFVIGLTLGLIIGGRGKRGARVTTADVGAAQAPVTPGATAAGTTRMPEHLFRDEAETPKA